MTSPLESEAKRVGANIAKQFGLDLIHCEVLRTVIQKALIKFAHKAREEALREVAKLLREQGYLAMEEISLSPLKEDCPSAPGEGR